MECRARARTARSVMLFRMRACAGRAFIHMNICIYIMLDGQVCAALSVHANERVHKTRIETDLEYILPSALIYVTVVRRLVGLGGMLTSPSVVIQLTRYVCMCVCCAFSDRFVRA